MRLRPAAVAGVIALALVTGCGGPAPQPVPSPSASEPIRFSLADYPRVDGSTATQPLNLAFKEAFTATDLNPDDLPVSKTHRAYLRLIAGEVDLILVTSPSADELAAAQAAGVGLEVIPVVHEGFVFITNAGNPVTSLTVDQLRDIYAGRITNWNQVGGPDSPMVAYQRGPNSGSQTGMLDLVMKGTPMVEAPQQVIPTMEGTVDIVAGYDNSSGALGYSYYYFVTAMYGDLATGNAQDGVRLLEIDGVAPTEESIRSGDYPLTSSYYIVMDKAAPADSPARRLAQAMLSPEGQLVAQQAGYVPIADVAPAPPPTYAPPPPGPYSITSLAETYRLYPLTLTESKELQGNTTVVRLTIDGLADQRVEDAINALLREKQDEFVKRYRPLFVYSDITNRFAGQPLDDEGHRYLIYAFGNVLSFWYHSESFAVRLDTGEVIDFLDLFVDGAPVEGILASAYRRVAVIGQPEEPADIEAQIIDLISDYRRDPDVSFHIMTPWDVSVRIGERQFTIELPHYWQSVALYKRFLTAEDAGIYASPAAAKVCPVFHLPGSDGACHQGY